MFDARFKKRLQRFLSGWLFVILIWIGVCVATAYTLFAAEPVPPELKNAVITEHFGDQVDLNLTFRNEKGELVSLKSVINGRRPTLLLLNYYGCPNLCGLFLNGVTESLKNLANVSPWIPGDKFQVLTISIDASETPMLASKKKANYMKAFGKDVSASWHFWVNDKSVAEKLDPEKDTTNIRKLANQVGFGYKWNKEQNQYAHSVAVVVLTPEGRVSRYLYGIEFLPKDLRLALVEAGGGKIGSLVDHLLLFCYHYDPKTKKYSLFATNLMKAGGGVTVILVAGSLVSFWGFSWRRRKKKGRTS